MVQSGWISPIATSRTLRQVAILALVMGLYSGLVLWIERSLLAHVSGIPSDIHAAFSLILGAMLVFRTNTAYSRWWEARTLWGSLVNASRNFAIKITSFSRLSAEELHRAKSLLIAYPLFLRNHLRDGVDAMQDVQGPLLDQPRKHPPTALVQKLFAIVACGRSAGVIDGDELRALDLELTRFLEICGGCERIHRTRIVSSYRVFARQCVMLYLLSLPWGIVHDFGWCMVPMTIMSAYFMLGLEIVAEHVEEPFGFDEDDLDLDGLCHTIEASVEEVFQHAKNRSSS